MLCNSSSHVYNFTKVLKKSRIGIKTLALTPESS